VSKLVRLFSVNSDLSDKYSLSFNLVLVGIGNSFYHVLKPRHKEILVIYFLLDSNVTIFSKFIVPLLV
jgi:hypothetical protein